MKFGFAKLYAAPCAALALVLGSLVPTRATAAPATQMSYTTAATAWKEALPVGNGRMGGMVYGTTAEEHMQFNENTLWVGEPRDYSRGGGAAHLAGIRTKVNAGNITSGGGAESDIETYLLSNPYRQPPYQPFGDLYFTGHGSVTNYTRTLDLDKALATVAYDASGVHYKRECFATKPHNAIVTRISAGTAGSLSTTIRLETTDINADAAYTDGVATVVGSDRIKLTGRLPFSRDFVSPTGTQTISNPLSYEAQVKVIAEGGTVTPSGSTLVVSGATTVTLLLVARTNFVNFQDVSANQHTRCEDDITALAGQTFATLQAEQLADYQALFRRVSVDLGDTAGGIASQSISTRLSGFWNSTTPSLSNSDPDLVELYYQYGRYLLISSSRTGGEPANLQGLWNCQTEPSWECKYTTNINEEMNYWPAESTNLAECVDPLIDMIGELRVSGGTVATSTYGCRGWTVNHNTDLWRGAAPINHYFDGPFPAGGAWMCQHLWWHYEYSGDTTFLSATAYPAMKEAALFLIDYLVADPNHSNYLVTNPTNSPEHGPNGGEELVSGDAMDTQIIREFFADTIKAAQVLGVDADLQSTLTTKLSKLPPYKIGALGQIQEWLDYVDDHTDTHRHISHLWGLFPGEAFNRTTTTLFNAAKVALTNRGGLTDATAGGNTGWAQAHRLNCWARELDGTNSYITLQGLLKKKTLLNLMNRGGATTVDFQIDGNLGGTSGITEMLLQSHAGEVALLPALPPATLVNGTPVGWATGTARGLRARGGLTVSMAWSAGDLTSATLLASLNKTIKLRVPASKPVVALMNGAASVSFTTNGDGTISFATTPGANYTVWFTAPTPVTLSSFEVSMQLPRKSLATGT